MGEYIYRKESSSKSLGDDYLLFERNRIPEGNEELTPRKYLGDPFSEPAPKKSELDLIREEAESLKGKETSGEVLTAEEKEFLEYVDNVEAVLNKKSESVEKKLESLEKKKLQPKKKV